MRPNQKSLSRLALEVHNPANCAAVLPDLVGLGIFTYGSHYCSVDNKHHATTLACGYFNSGIRVFDIRNPRHPKEIALLQSCGRDHRQPGFQPRDREQFCPRRSRLVLGAGFTCTCPMATGLRPCGPPARTMGC